MARDIIKRKGEGGQSHKRYRLTNSTIVEIGNPVYLTSGRLDLSTTSSAVLGISRENKRRTRLKIRIQNPTGRKNWKS